MFRPAGGPGQAPVIEVHEALVAELAEKKLLRGRKVRADTPVAEAGFHDAAVRGPPIIRQ